MPIAVRHAALLAAMLAGLSLTGCDSGSQKATAPQAEKAAPAPAPAALAEAPVAPAPAAPTTPAPAAKPAKPVKVDQVEKAEKVVSAPKKGEREKLGAGQCRVCHPIQYNSWVKSGHARKALDCEGCHGYGSEYAKNSVMRDLAKAKAAGLIFQKAQFCEKCHPTADDSFLPKAHAHKPKAEPKPAP
jgi:hypothetical protein